MKETRWENDALVDTEGKCQPRNKNRQQINANDKHTRKLKRSRLKTNVDSPQTWRKCFLSTVSNELRVDLYEYTTRYELEINKVSAQNLLHPIKYSITHKHTFAKANNDHAAPPLKTPKGHLIGQWM